MKRMLPTTQYYFYAGSNFIDFSMYPDFDPKRLLAVINTTVGQTLIYATGGGLSSPTGGAFSGSAGNYQLYLNYNTGSSGMSDYDILQIIYDESVGVEDAKSSVDIVSGKNGLDVNLLNSSFGGTVGDVMPAPFQDNALSIGILNGGVLESPAMNVNNELIVDCTQSGPIPFSVAGSVNVYGTVSVDNFPASQAVTGTFYPAIQAVSATTLPLPTGAATSALQTTGNTSLSSVDGKLTTLNAKDFSTSALQTTGNSILTSIDSKATSLDNKTPTLGQKVSSGSSPVVIASDQSTLSTFLPDLFVTGQAAQSTAVNNILLVNSGAGSTDASGYRSASVQITSTATAGTLIFEGSNDNVNFQTIPVYNQLTLTGTPIAAGISATASQIIYTFPIQARYIRLRISSSLTGGSVQAFTRLSQAAWSPTITQVGQNTNSNLNVSATIASGTVTTVSTVSNVNSAILSSSFLADIASGSITTTTTSASISNSLAQCMSIVVAVTGASGTGQTLDIVLQESMNNSVDWYDIYHFPRITTVGAYQTPVLKLAGVNYRIIRTVAGVTPNFTMSLTRTNRQIGTGYNKSFINRTIDPNTLNSVSPSYFTDGCDRIHLCVTMSSGGSVSPVFKLQGSEDQTNWYDLGAATITGAPSTSLAVSYSGLQPKYTRAIVATAGTGATLTSLCIKALGN